MKKEVSFLERNTMKLARFVAGPKRSQWLDAMDRELETLQSRRMDWALGCLVASTKDRIARNWPFGAALVVLPAVALVASVATTFAVGLLDRALGLPPAVWSAAMLLAPIPFAYLLGRLCPPRSAWRAGATAWLIYQLVPPTAFNLIFGAGAGLSWGPNLSHIGLPNPWQVPAVAAVWILGAIWGSRRQRRDPQFPLLS